MKKREFTGIELGEASIGMEEDYISSKELDEMMASDDAPVVIDLREDKDAPYHCIEGAITITMQNLVIENLEKTIPDKTASIVLICEQSFTFSRMVPLTTYAYPTLKLMGYTSIKVLSSFP